MITVTVGFVTAHTILSVLCCKAVEGSTEKMNDRVRWSENLLVGNWYTPNNNEIRVG